MQKQETKINNPLDAAIYDLISNFAIVEIEKMAQGTFKADNYKINCENTTIEVMNNPTLKRWGISEEAFKS